jgi:hypothetical protein
MRRSQSSRAFALAIVVVQHFLVQPPLSAETFDERHARDIAANASDLQFRLSIPNRTVFTLGERIPITLEFSSGSPDKYKLNGATYDRGGRLPTEEFVLDRADVPDPYLDYFGVGVLGGIAGGLRNYPVLESKAYVIPLDLNDWFRFDSPGPYRLYLKSHRLTRERAPGESGEGRTVAFAAVSNILKIEILPRDQGWEAQKLGEIRSILDQPEPEHPKPGGPPVPYNPLEEKVRQALLELRYLGTEDAVRLTFERARKPGGTIDTLGLVGARNRAHVIAEFDRYLADSEVGFSEWDVRVRALFSFVEKDAPGPLPQFPWQLSKRSDVTITIAALETRQKRFQEFVGEEAVRLIPLVGRKDARARKISAEAVASVTPDRAKAAGLIPADDYGLTRAELITKFVQLPTEQQSELLAKKWDLVRGPEMVPVLMRVIATAQPKPFPQHGISLLVWGVEGGLPETALRRLYEMAPSEAAAILRRDIASGKPRFAGFAVREFPAQDVPEADAALSALLKTDFPGALPLVAKFGTARLANQVMALYTGHLWPCTEEESFTTYFVRTLPGDGPGRGTDVLRRAMADRERRGCYRMLLNQISRVFWNRSIEAQAVVTVNDPDPEAAMSAVQVLAAHGGPGVEPLLWKRLEHWSDTWRGRAANFATNPIAEAAPNRNDERLGSALFQAIGSAKSWLLDEPRRERLISLCVEDWCKERWSRDLLSGTILVDVSYGGAIYPAAFRVAGFEARTFEELETKMQQFPAGTKFRWCPQAFNPFDAFTPGQRKEMFERLTTVLSKRSISVEPYSEEKCLPGSAGR